MRSRVLEIVVFLIDLMQGSQGRMANSEELALALESRGYSEDEISTECKDLIMWECVKYICTILKQWQVIQEAKDNIAEQRQLLKKRNSEYKMANFKIRYRNT